MTGQEKVAKLLIHNGADFTVKNKDGKLASEIATENGKIQQIFYFRFHFINLCTHLLKSLLGFIKLARVLQENVAQKGDRSFYKVKLWYALHTINSFNSNVFKNSLRHIFISAIRHNSCFGRRVGFRQRISLDGM